jgi:ATP-dependent Clp protease ATP-binding subunit ClpA
MTYGQPSQLDRLSDASNMALFRARSAVSEHGGTAITDVHLLMGLLNAAPDLAPLLSPRLPVQRLGECLIGAIVSSSMPPSGAEVPMDETVTRALKRGAELASAPDTKVEPAHLMLALLRDANAGAAVGCLKQVGVDVDAAITALTGYIAR